MDGDDRDAAGARVVEVEFALADSSCPFIGTTERADCTFELAEMIPRGDGRYAEFFHVTGADPDVVLGDVDGREAIDVTVLSEYDDGALFEFLVSGQCPAFALAERGGLPRTVRSEDGEGTIVVEIPSRYDPPAVIESFLDEYPDADITAKRCKETVAPRFTRTGFQQVLAERLTERQEEVLSTAFEAGYYDWPRQCTGEEVAERLGITSATFCEHIHAAERRLLTLVFSDDRRE